MTTFIIKKEILSKIIAIKVLQTGIIIIYQIQNQI